MYYPRKLASRIRPFLSVREIIVITGMRRVGKTTLLKMLFEKTESRNKVFLDFENIIERRIFDENDYNNIWANLKAYGINTETRAWLFIDEIQTSPEAVRAVKYLYDHYDVKFFITGSSSYYLKNLFPESLAGRKILFELFPLDFEEFLVFNGEKKVFYEEFNAKDANKNIVAFEKTQKYYAAYLTWGGFPQIVLANSEAQKRMILKDIFNSYFQKDVLSLADFRKISRFEDLIFLLLERTGSRLDITRLSQEVGVSRETVYNYLSFLSGTYFIFLLPPFSRKRDSEIRKRKKVYICDNGFLSLFSRVSEGALLENAVYLNLKKYGQLSYFQTPAGREIDFILNKEGIALEVKKRGYKSDYNKLTRLSENLKMKGHYIISQAFSKDKGIIPCTEI